MKTRAAKTKVKKVTKTIDRSAKVGTSKNGSSRNVAKSAAKARSSAAKVSPVKSGTAKAGAAKVAASKSAAIKLTGNKLNGKLNGKLSGKLGGKLSDAPKKAAIADKAKSKSSAKVELPRQAVNGKANGAKVSGLKANGKLAAPRSGSAARMPQKNAAAKVVAREKVSITNGRPDPRAGNAAAGEVRGAEAANGRGVPGTASGRSTANGPTVTKVNAKNNDAKTGIFMTETRVSKELEFKEGDKVVYPAHGVGVVESIQLRKISGAEQKFYMVTIVDTGMKIMVPTAQVKTVGLRRVVDTKTVDEVYEILRDRSITVDNQTWNRRYREYSQKIKTGSVLEIARVIRDLSVLKSDKELSFGERRMLDTAQGLLVKELSIAKSSSEDSIKAELEQLCAAA